MSDPLEAARTLLSEGEPGKARALLEQALGREPERAELLLEHASSCAALDDFAGVEASTSRLLSRDPACAPARALRGRARLAALDLTGAEADADAALAVGPSLEAHLTKANVLAARGDLGAARDQFQRARALDPSSADAALGLGWTRWLEGDEEPAFALLVEAGELDPLHPPVWSSLAALAAERGDWDLGLVCADLAERIGGPLPHVPPLRAACLAGLGRDEEAEDALAEAVDTVPRDPGAWLALAAMEVRSGTHAAARESAETAVEVAGGDPAVEARSRRITNAVAGSHRS